MVKLWILTLIAFFGMSPTEKQKAFELAQFNIKEPLGVSWPDEWLNMEVTIDTNQVAVPAQSLCLLQVESSEGKADLVSGDIAPAQFYHEGKLLSGSEILKGRLQLQAFCNVNLQKGRTSLFKVIAVDTNAAVSRPALQIVEKEHKTTVENGIYEITFDTSIPLPVNEVRCGRAADSLVGFEWPAGAKVSKVEDCWLERGQVRAILKRNFHFRNPVHRYVLTLVFRAGDPWIDISDEYSLGRGSFIKADLYSLQADTVYHPHTYNARTFRPDAKAEDSTIQPPQHPIATLGPVWRDIWFGGGPFGFVYNSNADYGLGFATVRGSEWKASNGVSLVSQNLSVNGDREVPGRVWLKLPTDGGKRHWALIVGPLQVRKKLGQLTRARADIPLETVLNQWILDWDSDAQPHDYGFAKIWFGPFNRHQLNPTTFPRRVRSNLSRMLDEGRKVKSPDLAMLAYVFMDPDYWPGPDYHWGNIGNPNFHTDMYNIPLQIGLLMPDHPHAKQWVGHGVSELNGNLMRDSYPGGAWAESLSYSAFFFHIVDYAKRIRDAGVASPFRDWPRLKEVATYLACMHGPVDPRYGSRQRAPIGDTHPGNYIEQLQQMGKVYRGVDDHFAEQLERFPTRWEAPLDIASKEFYGFGAMLRGNPYNERHESFVTIKAGPARNHYQGDELSFYFCSLSTPLALDYACHYSPRPWSASMHNRPDMNGLRPVAVGVHRAFATSQAADVFVADEQTRRISHVPMQPHQTVKPGWEYPTTFLLEDKPWTMRRYVMLVKHDPSRCQIVDYLVVRDEISSPQEVWWNLHILARDIWRNGQVMSFTGQLGVDVNVHFISPKLDKIEKRQWGWSKERTKGSLKNWKEKQYEQEHFGHYIPDDFERGTWGRSFEHSGEMGKWLRVHAEAGRTNWLVILMPYLRGQEEPKIEKLSATSARVSVGQESEVIHLGTEGMYQAAIERYGKPVVLLDKGQVKPWSELSFESLTADVGKDAR